MALGGILGFIVDITTKRIDLHYLAWVAIGVLILSLFLIERNSRYEAESTGLQCEVPCGKRVGIDLQGGSGTFRNTKIRNQDVGFRARNTVVKSDDLDVE